MRGPIQIVLDAVAHTACNRNAHAPGHAVLRRGPSLDGQAGKSDQIGRLPPIERQIEDPLRLDDRSHTRASRFDRSRACLHLDRFGDLADAEHYRNRRIAANLQLDSSLHVAAESSLGCFQSIGA